MQIHVFVDFWIKLQEINRIIGSPSPHTYENNYKLINNKKAKIHQELLNKKKEKLQLYTTNLEK